MDEELDKETLEMIDALFEDDISEKDALDVIAARCEKMGIAEQQNHIAFFFEHGLYMGLYQLASHTYRSIFIDAEGLVGGNMVEGLHTMLCEYPHKANNVIGFAYRIVRDMDNQEGREVLAALGERAPSYKRGLIADLWEYEETRQTYAGTANTSGNIRWMEKRLGQYKRRISTEERANLLAFTDELMDTNLELRSRLHGILRQMTQRPIPHHTQITKPTNPFVYDIKELGAEYDFVIPEFRRQIDDLRDCFPVAGVRHEEREAAYRGDYLTAMKLRDAAHTHLERFSRRK